MKGDTSRNFVVGDHHVSNNCMLWQTNVAMKKQKRYFFQQIKKKKTPSAHNNANYFIHLCWSFPYSLNKNRQENTQKLETFGWTLHQPRLLFFFLFSRVFLFFLCGGAGRRRKPKKTSRKLWFKMVLWRVLLHSQAYSVGCMKKSMRFSGLSLCLQVSLSLSLSLCSLLQVCYKQNQFWTIIVQGVTPNYIKHF